MFGRLTIALAALAISAFTFSSAAAQNVPVVAHLQNQDGADVGTVTFTQLPGRVQVDVDVAGLPQGFHGFHVHSNGVCNASDQFTSAGGHLDLGTGDMTMVMGSGQSMPMDGGHAGDMTNLYVTRDGTGSLHFVLDRFSVSDLLSNGGRAVIVHGGPDNFRNIPDRYGVTIDQATMDTGDAGPRLACGVVQIS
jgi:Cu-Zn family superoxide dismutase